MTLTAEELVALAMRYAEENGCALRGLVLLLRPNGKAIEVEHRLSPGGTFQAGKSEVVRAGQEAGQEIASPVRTGTGPLTPDPCHAGPKLSPQERQIIEVLKAVERPVKQLIVARRLGKEKVNSHLKLCFQRLKRFGLVSYIEGRGFWLTARPVPAAA